MSEFYVIPGPDIAWCSGNTYVTCAGFVRAPHGAGVVRRIDISHDTCNTPIATTYSTLPLGEFTVQVPGLPTDNFTVVAHGAAGENSVIYSHVQDLP